MRYCQVNRRESDISIPVLDLCTPVQRFSAFLFLTLSSSVTCFITSEFERDGCMVNEEVQGVYSCLLLSHMECQVILDGRYLKSSNNSIALRPMRKN